MHARVDDEWRIVSVKGLTICLALFQVVHHLIQQHILTLSLRLDIFAIVPA
jgi:hypothetical protein